MESDGRLTLRLRRPLFCCCCCSMSSMAEAGGEAALMARTTLMLSSGSGGRPRRWRPRTFISWSSWKPPSVNFGRGKTKSISQLWDGNEPRRAFGFCLFGWLIAVQEQSSRAEGALSSLGSVERSCCRTWSPWWTGGGQRVLRCKAGSLWRSGTNKS